MVDVSLEKTGAPLNARVTSKNPLRAVTKDGKGKHIFRSMIADSSSGITVLAVDPIATFPFEKIEVGAFASYKTEAKNPFNPQSKHDCELEVTEMSIPT